jgi:hypothetical protein
MRCAACQGGAASARAAVDTAAAPRTASAGAASSAKRSALRQTGRPSTPAQPSPISMFSFAAAWVIWPAIASARSWA